MTGADFPVFRNRGRTIVPLVAAAGVENASGRGIEGRGHIALKGDPSLHGLGIRHGRGRKQGLGVRMAGAAVNTFDAG